MLPFIAVRFFCFHMDEYIDFAGLEVLLVFVRYVYNADVKKDLHLCKILTTFNTGDKIFKIFDLFMIENGILRKKFINVCTGRVKSITDLIKVVVS